MKNHYHLVVYCDPKAPNNWSDVEVAEKWLSIFPGAIRSQSHRNLQLKAILSDKTLLKSYRERLGSLSWLMKCINEPLAKKSNREDFVKGHFWESRFSSQALLDEAAAIACMAYVDLNPVRAGITQRLESSDHTSIKNRISSMNQTDLKRLIKPIVSSIQAETLSVSLGQYLDLVEWTGRNIRHKNKAHISGSLPSLFERLNLAKESWLTVIITYNCCFYRALGSPKHIQSYTTKLKQKWIKGKIKTQSFYLPST